MRSYEVGVQFFLKTQPVFPALSTPLKSLQVPAAAPHVTARSVVSSTHDPIPCLSDVVSVWNDCPLFKIYHQGPRICYCSLLNQTQKQTKPCSFSGLPGQSLSQFYPQGNALGMDTSLLHPHAHHPTRHLVRSMFPNHSTELHLATHWSWPSDHHNTWLRPSFPCPKSVPCPAARPAHLWSR